MRIRCTYSLPLVSLPCRAVRGKCRQGVERQDSPMFVLSFSRLTSRPCTSLLCSAWSCSRLAYREIARPHQPCYLSPAQPLRPPARRQLLSCSFNLGANPSMHGDGSHASAGDLRLSTRGAGMLNGSRPGDVLDALAVLPRDVPQQRSRPPSRLLLAPAPEPSTPQWEKSSQIYNTGKRV